MELNNIVKILAFLTSYCPLWILLIIKYGLNEDLKGDLILKTSNIYKYSISYPLISWNIPIFILISLILISLVCIFLFFKAIKPGEKDTNIEYYKIIETEDNDSDILGYLFTYIIPSLSIGGDISKLIQLILFIVIASFYITSNSLITLNPVIRILGYHIYKAKVIRNNLEQSVYIISKLKNALIEKNTNIKLLEISSNIFYLERGGKH